MIHALLNSNLYIYIFADESNREVYNDTSLSTIVDEILLLMDFNKDGYVEYSEFVIYDKTIK